jgi:hypothetical protein
MVSGMFRRATVLADRPALARDRPNIWATTSTVSQDIVNGINASKIDGLSAAVDSYGGVTFANRSAGTLSSGVLTVVGPGVNADQIAPSTPSGPLQSIDFAKWDDGTPTPIMVETPRRNTASKLEGKKHSLERGRDRRSRIPRCRSGPAGPPSEPTDIACGAEFQSRFYASAL